MEGMALNDHLNDYFSTIGSKLAEKCTPSSPSDNAGNNDDTNIVFDRTLFTEAEVLKVCNDIDIEKSAAITNVKSFVLKHTFIS